jgi:hypothetical protein
MTTRADRAAAASRNGSVTMPTAEERIATLEEQVQLLAWLHAEVVFGTTKMAHALAAMLAQQMQPQIHAALLQQLMGVKVPPQHTGQ